MPPVRSPYAPGSSSGRFLDARADGSTLSGNWLYIGMLHRGRQPDAAAIERATRAGSAAIPTGPFSWPANRRILYNRCSADGAGTTVGSDARRHRVERREAGSAIRSRLQGGQRRRTRESVRSSCFPKAWRGCSCRGSSSTDRGRSTTSRSNRRSRIRCIPSTARTRPCKPFNTPVRHARQAGRVPDRLHDLPADRALPLLDEEQSLQHAAAAGVLRRDPGGTGARRRASRTRDMVRVTSARGSIEGSAMVTRRIKPMHDRRTAPCIRSDSRSTGASSGAASSEGRSPICDAHRRGSELVRAGVQGLPGEAGEGLGGAMAANPRTSPRLGEPPPAPGIRAVPSRRQAHRHLDVHRLQGLRGGVPGMERPAAAKPRCSWAPTRRCPTCRRTSGT